MVIECTTQALTHLAFGMDLMSMVRGCMVGGMHCRMKSTGPEEELMDLIVLGDI